MSRWFVLAVLCTGCLSTMEVEVPPPDADIQTVFIASHRGTDVLSVAVLLPDQVSALSIPAEVDAMTVVFHPNTAEELQVSLGSHRIPDGAPRRPLPLSGAKVLRGVVQNDTVALQTTTSTIEVAITISPLDFVRCASAGGCLASQQAEVCSIPCEPMKPDAPTDPELPDLTPCPAGWELQKTVVSDVSYCEPDRSADPCAIDAALFPGGAECRSIGTVCPAGEWPANAPNGAVFVSASAPGGGDGSRTAPLRLREALQQTGTGTVLLGKGRHVGGVVQSDLLLQGACVAETIVVAPPAGPSLRFLGDAELRNLAVHGEQQVGIELAESASLLLSAVLVTSVTTAIDLPKDGYINAEDLIVRDAWIGLDAAASDVVVRTASFENCRSFGIRLETTTATITDVAIRGTNGAGESSSGLFAIREAQVKLERASFSDNRGFGVYVREQTELDARDLVVRRTLTSTSCSALQCAYASRCTLERFFADDNYDDGFHLRSGSWGVLTDAIITRTRRTSEGGHGIRTREGRELQLVRVLSALNEGYGVRVSNRTSWIEDLTILQNADNSLTFVDKEDSHPLEAHRIRIEGNCPSESCDDEVSLDGEAMVSDLIQLGGAGIEVDPGSDVVLQRAVVIDGVAVGLRTTESSLRASDVRIERIAPESCRGWDCVGGGVRTKHGQVELERFVVSDCSFGLRLESAEGVAVRDGVISRTAVGVHLPAAELDLRLLLHRLQYLETTKLFDLPE